jgi:hypothetical protein
MPSNRSTSRTGNNLTIAITTFHTMSGLHLWFWFLSTCLFLYVAWEMVLDDRSSLQKQNGVGTSRKRPNIVLILTDDQDLHMNSMDYMPLTRELIADEGTEFTHHFCTNALCCPSRVTLWTGKSPHNHNVTDVNPPHGNMISSCSLQLLSMSNLFDQAGIPSSSLKASTTTTSPSGYNRLATTLTTRASSSMLKRSQTTTSHMPPASQVQTSSWTHSPTSTTMQLSNGTENYRYPTKANTPPTCSHPKPTAS